MESIKGWAPVVVILIGLVGTFFTMKHGITQNKEDIDEVKQVQKEEAKSISELSTKYEVQEVRIESIQENVKDTKKILERIDDKLN